jgi:co-chaperonin GroES (HSP10)
MANNNSITTKEFHPAGKSVFVTDLDSGAKTTKAGLIIPDDDMTNRGIRPRWGRIYAVGPLVDDVKVGEWILIDHGRWTNKITLDIEGEGEVQLWRIEHPESTFIVCDEDPRNVTGDLSTPSLEFAMRHTNW